MIPDSPPAADAAACLRPLDGARDLPKVDAVQQMEHKNTRDIRFTAAGSSK